MIWRIWITAKGASKRSVIKFGDKKKMNRCSTYHFKSKSAEDSFIRRMADNLKSLELIMTLLDTPLIRADTLNQGAVHVWQGFHNHLGSGERFYEGWILVIDWLGSQLKRFPPGVRNGHVPASEKPKITRNDIISPESPSLTRKSTDISTSHHWVFDNPHQMTLARSSGVHIPRQ